VGEDHGLIDDPWAQSGAVPSFRVILYWSVFSGKEDEPTRVSVRHENRKTPLTTRSRLTPRSRPLSAWPLSAPGEKLRPDRSWPTLTRRWKYPLCGGSIRLAFDWRSY